jgi:hypothetical protein
VIDADNDDMVGDAPVTESLAMVLTTPDQEEADGSMRRGRKKEGGGAA